MKLPVTIATLFLATSAALPAFATAPLSIPLRDAAAAPVETVQYRNQQTPRENHRYQAYRNSNGYHAYASTPRSANSPSHDLTRGWPCESHSVDSGFYSAYPNWEMCN